MSIGERTLTVEFEESQRERAEGDTPKNSLTWRQEQVLQAIREGARTRRQIADWCGITVQSVTEHLRFLVGAGYVSEDQVGNAFHYALVEDGAGEEDRTEGGDETGLAAD